MPDGEFHIPGAGHRTVIVGRTGTGKSVFAFHLLSHQDFNRRPWLLIDYKGEDLVRGIVRRAVNVIRPGALPGKEPGIYYMNPTPVIDNEGVEETLWRIWERGRTGIFFDETFNLPNRSAAVSAILTQGRSKRIPVIACAQRPVNVDRNFFNQADYVCSFSLRQRDDQIEMENYLSLPKFFTEGGLPDRHAIWYDVKRDRHCILTPCPPPDHILSTLNARIPRRFFW